MPNGSGNIAITGIGNIHLIVPSGSASNVMYSMDEAGRLSAVLQSKGWTTTLQVGLIQPDVLKGNVAVLVLRWDGDECLPIIGECLQANPSAVIATGRIVTTRFQALLQTHPKLTAAVIGEPETTLVELLRALEKGQVLEPIPGLALPMNGQARRTPPRACRAALDDLPRPDRRYLEPNFGNPFPVVPIESSRGCRGQCKFCTANLERYNSEGKKQIRLRTPESIVAEIADIVERYHKTTFYFVDDNFFADSASGKCRAEKLAHLLLREKTGIHFYIESRADDVEPKLFGLLKSAGLKHVFLGFESGSQRALDRYCKGTTVEQNRQAAEILDVLKIEWSVGFIFHDQKMVWEELGDNLRLIEALQLYKKKNFNFRGMTTFPGTTWEKEIGGFPEFSDAKVENLVAGLREYLAQAELVEYEYRQRQKKSEDLIQQIMQKHGIKPAYRFKLQFIDEGYFSRMSKFTKEIHISTFHFVQALYRRIQESGLQNQPARGNLSGEFLNTIGQTYFKRPLGEENRDIDRYLSPGFFRVAFRNEILTLSGISACSTH